MTIDHAKAADDEALCPAPGMGREYSFTSSAPDVQADDGASGGKVPLSRLTGVGNPTSAMAEARMFASDRAPP